MSKHWQKEVTNHEPTQLYYEKLVELIQRFKPETVLEVGTGWGVSGSAFMENGVKRLVTIDASTNPEYLETAKKEIELKLGLDQVVEYKWMRSREFFKNNSEKFDLIYIDGDHGYAGCKADLEAALECLKPGGHIIMDDYMHRGNYIDGNECRVAQAAREVIIEKRLAATMEPHNKENGFLII